MSSVASSGAAGDHYEGTRARLDFTRPKKSAIRASPTVLRACAMTLIVATDDEDEYSFAASQTSSRADACAS